jgi:hypothetical protein
MDLTLNHGAWKGLRLGGLALATFAAQQLGPGGIPSAQACAGGAPRS